MSANTSTEARTWDVRFVANHNGREGTAVVEVVVGPDAVNTHTGNLNRDADRRSIAREIVKDLKRKDIFALADDVEVLLVEKWQANRAEGERARQQHEEQTRAAAFP